MISVYVNKVKYFIKKQLSVFDGCKFLGLVIPRFCYHELLSIAGNCRMCLVEVVNGLNPIAAKPQVSCAIPFLPGLSVFLNTPLVQKARANVMEMLLVYHPLDCPICDQAGECDLQDQAKLYGVKFNRHFFRKRSVENKNTGAIVKTIMTRCIHCTRCVRFNKQTMQKKQVLGTINRGIHTEIGMYDNNLFNTELSGNLIDLCPVGAFTLKNYDFKTRPWDLKAVSTIDLTDSVGSSTFVYMNTVEIYKVVPRYNIEINERVISDRARFFFESLYHNRIVDTSSNKTSITLYETFVDILKSFKNNSPVTIICNPFSNFAELYLFKLLSYKYPHVYVKNLEINPLKTNIYSNLNHSILNIVDCSETFFLFSINLAVEAAVLGYRLRKRLDKSNLKCYSFSIFDHRNKFSTFINLNTYNATLLFKGKQKFFSKLLVLSSGIGLIFGEVFYSRGFNSYELISLLKCINLKCYTINVGSKANSEGSILNNIQPVSTQNLARSKKIIHLLTENNLRASRTLSFSNASTFWFHTHHSKVANRATYHLPVETNCAYEGIFFNCEGRAQLSQTIFPASKTVPSLYQMIHLFLGVHVSISEAKLLAFFKQFQLINDKEASTEVLNFEREPLFKSFSFSSSITNSQISLYPLKMLSYDPCLVNKAIGYNSKTLLRTSLTVLRSKYNQVF